MWEPGIIRLRLAGGVPWAFAALKVREVFGNLGGHAAVANGELVAIDDIVPCHDPVERVRCGQARQNQHAGGPHRERQSLAAKDTEETDNNVVL